MTFTANQICHFGLQPIREWINNKGWQKTYPNYNDLPFSDQDEINEAVNQASAGLMVRIWEEVSKFFLDFLTKSPHSPYKKVKATFARREYQSNSGNLAHSHIILAVDKELLTPKECEFVDNLGCASVFDVVKSENIEEYLEEGIISSIDDVDKRIQEADAFLTHKCSNRCVECQSIST